MNFFDDLKTKVEQAGKEVVGDIYSHIQSIKVEPVVKVSSARTGNLNAAQVANGVTAQAASASIAPDSDEGFDFKTLILPLVIGGALYFFLLGKKRG